MGFEFEYNLNGRKVTQQQWMNALEEQALKEALSEHEKEVHRKVATLRCPTHRRTPQIRTRIVGHELRSEVSACCVQMRDKAQLIAVGRA